MTAPMYEEPLGGKRDSVVRPGVITSQINPILLVTDRKSNCQYLLDTGVSVSVIPVSRKQGLQQDPYTLYAANGSPIGTYAADFLFYHGLLVDRETKKAATSDKVAEGTSTVYTIPAGSPYAELSQQFPDIIRPGNLHHEARHLADGSYWPCGEYRRLNTQTVPERSGLNINVHGATVFSTIDLERAYYQIPVAPEDVQKTAVTRLSNSGFTRMSFELRNAAQTFQRFIDSIFRDLSYVFPYTDDLLIASRSPGEHRRHLREVFSRRTGMECVLTRQP
ncbi:hypothetical protein AAG570_011867 [Ranatra chinensis]|uniref:Reverse transcriptase domain-containing protein n=1 Tax=Ranatra chinensis TaxID=642074 RepID=A0ABD0YH54_9HEMI